MAIKVVVEDFATRTYKKPFIKKPFDRSEFQSHRILTVTNSFKQKFKKPQVFNSEE